MDRNLKIGVIGDFDPSSVFLPQLSSTPAAPHPLVVAYLRAAVAFHDARSVRSQIEHPNKALEQTGG